MKIQTLIEITRNIVLFSISITYAFGQQIGQSYVFEMLENSTLTTGFCAGVVYDPSGAGGGFPYNSNENSIFVVEPGTASSCIEFYFTGIDIAVGDVLNVYDGNNISAPLIASFSGTVIPPAITAESGSLCLQFISDGTNQGLGFRAIWTCNPYDCDINSYINNTCLNSQSLCSDLYVPDNVLNGIGNNLAFTNDDVFVVDDSYCFQAGTNAFWYKFQLDSSTPMGSTLGFLISPNFPCDYDFQVYGPFDCIDEAAICNNLPHPIRCSGGSVLGSTGTISGGSGNYDPAGDSGDGFVNSLLVNPNETYLLLINRFSPNNSGFTLSWNGTATPFLLCDDAFPYCSSKGLQTGEEWIQKVKFNTIDNRSDCDFGYADFTCQVTDVVIGSSYLFELTPGFANTANTESWRVWIDYNHDSDFLDAGESILQIQSSDANSVSVPVVIQSNALPGVTGLRISMKNSDVWPTACETFEFGEVEDYSVNIIESPSASSITDSVCIVVGTQITLSVPDTLSNVYWYESGNAGAVLGIGNVFTTPSMSFQPIIYVAWGTGPLTPNGIAYYFTLFPQPNLIAGNSIIINSGQSVALTASGGGNTGYLWSPPSTLDAANIQNPIATPSQTTTYYVYSQYDNYCIAIDSTTVYVNQNPPTGIGIDIITGGNYSNPSYLVENVFLNGCSQISDVIFSGNLSSIGYFTNGESLGLTNGIIISSGAVTNAEGPNNQNNASSSFGTGGDSDLNNLISVDPCGGGGSSTQDAAVIEFNFVPLTPSIQFQYVFASEEYPEFVCTGFNDVFGFFISGPGLPIQNIALIPASNTYVGINTVNFSNNSTYFIGNPTNSTITEFDGFTSVFTANATGLIPCETYTIKLAVADVGDLILDSAVFLAANSFTVGSVDISSNATINGNQNAYEGCGDGYFTFQRTDNTSLSTPISMTISVGGSAVSGLDYLPLPDTITIPAGVSSVTLPVVAYSDNLNEGVESILISVTNSLCNCTFIDTATLFILEAPTITGISPDATICSGQSTTITATGGSTYLWNTGAVSNAINVNPTTTATYTVTVTSNLGCTSSASSTITVDIPNSIIVVASPPTICAGESSILTAFGGNNYLWNTGNTEPSIIVNPTTTTTYTVTATSPSGCLATTSISVNVNAPNISISPAGPITLCANSLVTLQATSDGGVIQWYKDGVFVTFNVQTLTISTPGSYYATSTINGCASTSNTVVVDYITLQSINITPEGPVSLCEDSVLLQATSVTNASYQWNLNGIPVFGGNSNTLLVNSGGDYTVSVSIGNCGTLSENVVVTDSPDFPISIIPEGPFSICLGQEVFLQTANILGTTYQWLYNGQTITGATNWNYIPIQEGIYSVATTSANCSKVSDVIYLNIDSLDSVMLTSESDTIICNNEEITLSATSYENALYVWLKDNAPVNTSSSSTLTISEGGNYSVNVVLGSCSKLSNTIMVNQVTIPDVTISASSSQIVTCSGNTATLSAVPFVDNATYQWFIDGNLIMNANSNEYTAQIGGNYSFTITLEGCSFASDILTLTEITPPTLTITNINGLPLCSNQPIVLQVNPIPGVSTYSWYRNGFWIGEGLTFSPVENGMYQVVVNDWLDCILVSNQININSPPPAFVNVFGAIPFCSGETIQLIVSPSSGANYQWYYNGNPITNATSPNIIVGVAGIYYVIVTSALGCSATSTNIVVNMYDPFYADAGPDIQLCSGNQTTLSANGGANYHWKWTTEDTTQVIDTTQSITITSVPQMYIVTVENEYGCSAQDTVIVSEIPSPIVSISTNSSTAFCQGESIILNSSISSGTPPFNYQWIRNFSQITDAINSTYAASTEGLYWLTITDANGCVRSSNIMEVTVWNLPFADIVVNPDTVVCENDTVSLMANTSPNTTVQWYSNNNPTNITTSTFNAIEGGTYYALLTTNNGCQIFTDTINITVNALPLISINLVNTNDTQICPGNSVPIEATNNPYYIYQWLNNSEVIPSAPNNANYTVSDAGVYSVAVTDLNGCAATSNVIEITILPSPNISIEPNEDAYICEGDSATITVVADDTDYTYVWYRNGDEIPNATGQSYVAQEAGQYFVVATNEYNCFAPTNPLTIFANSNPVATINPSDTTLCTGSTISLQASLGNSYNYLWSNGSITTTNNIAQSGTYTVTVTDTTTNCFSVSSPATVIDVLLPSAYYEINYINNYTIEFINNSENIVNHWWNFGDNSSAFMNNPIHEYENYGIYNTYLVVNNVYGCLDTSFFPVVVKPYSSETNAILYPNPNDGDFFLNLNIDTNSIVLVDMFDVLGRKVYSVDFGILNAGFHRLFFDANSLGDGVYILGVLINDQISNLGYFDYGILEGERLKYAYQRKVLILKKEP